MIDEWLHVVVQSDGKKFRTYADGENVAETDFQETRGANTILGNGLDVFHPVKPQDKLTTKWAHIKHSEFTR